MKLISMMDFVEIVEHPQTQEHASNETALRLDFYDSVTRYAKFLKQPLTLGMFVPCNEDGKVLIDPSKNLNLRNPDFKHIQYKEAQERVLFEGFNHIEGGVYSEYEIIKIKDIECKKIEDLVKEDCYLTLTPNAIKQIQCKQES